MGGKVFEKTLATDETRIEHGFLKTMKTKIVIALVAILGWQIGAQTVTNTPSGSPAAPSPAQEMANRQGQAIPPADLDYFRKQGYTDAEIQQSYQPAQPQKATLSPTPSDLKNAYIWMDNFIGMTNANIMADIISMKAETLKFRLYGKDYDYSGHYTVMLNTPRKHANPYFGLGSPETVKILILENVGGDTFPLQNATIWEKKSNFIDAVAMDKEWIYSGSYTIQN
jgi:hypothetical protein